ncbi:MAG: CoA transferase, partial [Acidimicrobiia bacterium]
VAASLEAGAISYIHTDARVGRSGIEHPLAPHRLFRARDGWVAGGLGGNPRMWDGLLEWMAETGEEADLGTDAMRDPASLPENRAHVFDVIERFTAQRTRDELFHEGQRRRLPWASVLTADEVTKSPQLEARGALVDVEYDGRVATDVAPPLRRSGARRVAPAAAAAANWLGSYDPPARTVSRGALDGIVVLDLTWVLAGPYATRILADHGARVIKIESEHRPDPTRFSRFTHLSRGEFDPNTSGYFNNVNRNKQSVQLNLRDPAGVDVLLDLVERADVVIENFSAGLLDRMGIGAPVLHERNPRLVVTSMSGLGATGPWRSYVSYADAISALCGFTSLCDDGDRLSPVVHGLADIVAGHHAALATIAALLAGGGAWVDLSQLEAMAAQIGPALLEPPAPRLHDRVYRCLGPDRWVAAEADLDEAWTRARPAEAAAEALQAQRIAAGVVQDGRDLVEHDPQLRACGFYPVVEHPVAGDFLHEGVPIKLSATPGSVWTAAPLLGADTDEVLESLAGYSIADIAKLRDAGVLA